MIYILQSDPASTHTNTSLGILQSGIPPDKDSTRVIPKYEKDRAIFVMISKKLGLASWNFHEALIYKTLLDEIIPGGTADVVLPPEIDFHRWALKMHFIGPICVLNGLYRDWIHLQSPRREIYCHPRCYYCWRLEWNRPRDFFPIRTEFLHVAHTYVWWNTRKAKKIKVIAVSTYLCTNKQFIGHV